MEIFLVRHATAVTRASDALDHARPLSQKGRRRFEREVAGLDLLGVQLDHIYHSPWIRAVQTGELLEPLLDRNPDPDPDEGGVSPGRTPLEALAATPGDGLLGAVRGQRVALVGHEPWMGELMALLLLGDAASGALFPFRKGAIAHLRGVPTPGGTELLAFYPPRVLRAAGRK